MATLTTLHNRLARLEARRVTTTQRRDVVTSPSLDAAKMRDILTKLVDMGVFAPNMVLKTPQMLQLRELALRLGLLADDQQELVEINNMGGKSELAPQQRDGRV